VVGVPTNLRGHHRDVVPGLGLSVQGLRGPDHPAVPVDGEIAQPRDLLLLLVLLLVLLLRGAHEVAVSREERDGRTGHIYTYHGFPHGLFNAPRPPINVWSRSNSPYCRFYITHACVIRSYRVDVKLGAMEPNSAGCHRNGKRSTEMQNRY